MTAIINMASVSPWNSKIPGNRRLSDEKDSVVMSSSWSRAGEKSTGDGLLVNSNQNIDTSNSQDLNNSKNNIVNHRNFNGNSDTDAVDKHNLVSITENPFFKSYGKIRAPHSRNENRAERERIHSDSSPLSPKVFTENNSTSNSLQQDDDEEVEYHPGSGFVTKLLGKFKMKYEREERAYSPSVPIKRSSSLENILDNQPVGTSVKPMRGIKNDNVSSVIGQSNLNYRTKSVEHINSSNSSKKPVPGKRAPDVKLARKDIVIIESTKPGRVSPTPSSTQPTNHVRSGSVSPTISTTVLRDETTEVDELPRPNTVTNTRHLFESSQKGSKSRAAPARPSSSTGTRISTVAPTKNTSVSITTSAHSNKPNHSQKPTDNVTTRSTTDVKLPRSTLPPINNRNKKPSPVVTVAPYNTKSDENYSTTTSATIPLPQKPPTTPRHGNASADRKPLQTNTNQHFISTPRENKEEKTHQETKSEKILVTPDIKSEVKTPRDSVKTSEEIIPKKTENSIVTKDKIKNTDISKSKVNEAKVDSQQSGPIKGIPTIIAQRMKETSPDSVASNGGLVPSHSSNSELYNSGSNDILSKKRQAPAIPSSGVVTTETKKEVPEKEEISPRQNLHHAQKKSQDIGGPAMVFDSSMVAKKKRKPNYSNTTNNTGVPKLDLTGINDNNIGRHGYQEGYKPTEIKPCTIVFIGALVDLGRSLLKKDGKSSISKGRIKFNDQAMTLHEYPSELHSLEEYLLKHPEEEELIIESYRNDIEDEDTPPGTPRNNNDDAVLKSNTALSHSGGGGLSSYVSKYQSDFDWNDHREPDPIVIRTEPEPEIPKSEELIPAGEDDTNTWSESTTSDLLF